MTLEKLLRDFAESYLKQCFTCMPAIIVNVRDGEQLMVDVQPIVNKVLRDGFSPESPVLYCVPCYMPHTQKSSITMPVNQGDTVLLVFSQRDTESFLLGITEPHEPKTNRWMDINDAIAFVGVSPFQSSPNLKTKHRLPHSPNDLVITHNLGTERECEVRLSDTGDISITSPSKMSIKAKDFELTTD